LNKEVWFHSDKYFGYIAVRNKHFIPFDVNKLETEKCAVVTRSRAVKFQAWNKQIRVLQGTATSTLAAATFQF